MAAKDSDVQAAFAAYDAAVAQNIKLTADSYITLMFLSSGGDEWEELLDAGVESTDILQQQEEKITANNSNNNNNNTNNIDSKSLNSLSDYLQRCSEIVDHMKLAGYEPTEMCYTALARRDALQGKPREAFDRAKDLLERNIKLRQLHLDNNTQENGKNQTTSASTTIAPAPPAVKSKSHAAMNAHNAPRLRCFTPALSAFAVRKDAKNAFLVLDAILEAHLEPTEAEYRRILQAGSGGGVEWSDIEMILNRIQRELTILTPSTIHRIKELFLSPHYTTTGVDSRWSIDMNCTIYDDGACSTIEGSKLEAIDLNEEEYSEFKHGVAELAARQERNSNDFKVFVDWLGENGPYGVVIDGANVAFYGQNYETGGFSFAQIGAVVDKAQELHPNLRPLVLLHTNREKMPQAKSQSSQALLSRLRTSNQFFATPLGSNDDWYWIYAAVAAGRDGILVSNDEMRDHIFNMLAPKFFLKWKQRHQMRYSFSGGPSSLVFRPPPPYTTCTQYLSEYAMWVFPCSDGTWMSARMIHRD